MFSIAKCKMELILFFQFNSILHIQMLSGKLSSSSDMIGRKTSDIITFWCYLPLSITCKSMLTMFLREHQITQLCGLVRTFSFFGYPVMHCHLPLVLTISIQLCVHYTLAVFPILSVYD